MVWQCTSVFMTNKTPSGTKKRHRESIEQEKVTKWPKSCSFLFFFERTSSKSWLLHNSLCMKLQHFALSSAPAIAFFTTSQRVTRCLKLPTQKKYGFICDAIFFPCVYVHKPLSNEMFIVRNTVRVHLNGEKWLCHYPSLVLEQMLGSVVLSANTGHLLRKPVRTDFCCSVTDWR